MQTMPADDYIDAMLDSSPGYAEPLLNHLLDERELLLAAFEARTTIWSVN